MTLGGFISRVARYVTCLRLIFWPIKFYHLCDRFLFKFFSLCHIYVGCTNISFYERLSFNNICCTSVHFNIVVLTWYDFTSYSIVLPMLISTRVFRPWSFFLGVFFTSLLKFHIKVLAQLNYCVMCLNVPFFR